MKAITLFFQHLSQSSMPLMRIFLRNDHDVDSLHVCMRKSGARTYAPESLGLALPLASTSYVQ
jgi:hypothetical protein